jgi:hypothetical protein
LEPFYTMRSRPRIREWTVIVNVLLQYPHIPSVTYHRHSAQRVLVLIAIDVVLALRAGVARPAQSVEVGSVE